MIGKEDSYPRSLCYFPSNNVFVTNFRRHSTISMVSVKQESYFSGNGEKWCRESCSDYRRRKGTSQLNIKPKSVPPVIKELSLHNSISHTKIDGNRELRSCDGKLGTTEVLKTLNKPNAIKGNPCIVNGLFTNILFSSSDSKCGMWKEELPGKTHFLDHSFAYKCRFIGFNKINTEESKQTLGICRKIDEYLDAIPTTNYISFQNRNHRSHAGSKNDILLDSDDINTEKKINESSVEDRLKDSSETRSNNSNLPKERDQKIKKGKPIHKYYAKDYDKIDKELELWHNSHNSTLKWERVKSGVYLVGGSKVNLIKINGILYVKNSEFRKGSEKMHIAKFVEEKQLDLSKNCVRQ